MGCDRTVGVDDCFAQIVYFAKSRGRPEPVQQTLCVNLEKHLGIRKRGRLNEYTERNESVAGPLLMVLESYPALRSCHLLSNQCRDCAIAN